MINPAKYHQQNYRFKYNFWLILSIVIAILFSLSGLKLAFKSAYIIQDDARQHIFWMQQFQDADLFFGDLIANYFRSVAPWGFTNLYRLVNACGIDIFFFNKISTSILGIISTLYCFLVTLEIFPVPFAGFIAALLLNQNLWMVDDLSSGTPRAFIYPLFLGFIYYLLRGKLFLYLFWIILQGLFYPQTILLSIVILAIKLLSESFWHKDREWNQQIFYISGLIISIIILGFYALKTSNFGEVISVTEARNLPEFGNECRNAFFLINPVKFWLSGQRSGFFPREWQYTLMCSFGLSLWWFHLSPTRFPLVKKINHKFAIILEILSSSIIMFIVAHLFLFKLHLPSRYSQHTLRMIIAIVDGIVVAISFDAITKWLKNISKIGNIYLIKYLSLIIIISALLYPTYAVQRYDYRLGYLKAEAVELYQFLQQQPKDYLIASLSKEADFIPTFAQRSVLVAQEYAIPYHLGYYQQLRQRTQDLINAQYSLDINQIRQFIKQYQIDLWLLDKNSFTVDYLEKNNWLNQFIPEVKKAISIVNQKQPPALLSKINSCTIFEDRKHLLLETRCIN